MSEFRHGETVRHKKDSTKFGIAVGDRVFGRRIVHAGLDMDARSDYCLDDWEAIAPNQNRAVVKPTDSSPEFLLEVYLDAETNEYRFNVFVDGDDKCGGTVNANPPEPQEDLARAMVYVGGKPPYYIVRDSEDDTWVDVRGLNVRTWEDWSRDGLITLGWGDAN